MSYCKIMGCDQEQRFHRRPLFGAILLVIMFLTMLHPDVQAAPNMAVHVASSKALAHGPLFQTVPQIQPAYGATELIGPALEPCDTEGTLGAARVISAEDNWQEIIFNDAQAGETFLLRGGVYQATEQLRGPHGKSGQPVTIKPYNCEAVTLYATIRPGSYSTFAGLHIEAAGLSDTKWVVRLDGKNMGPLRGIVFRHNTIMGGDIDAFRISDDVVDVLLMGNHLDGGGNGHVLFVTSESRAQLPDQIVVTNNRLTKSYFDTPSEDLFQVRDVAHVEFSHNTCTDGRRMEQCVDIKSTTVPLLIRYNLFDGDALHADGAGEDRANGCMVIHETDGAPDSHRIEHNYFRNCKGEAIRFAQGNADEISSGIVRHNIFVSPGSSEEDGAIPIWQARHVRFINNTMIRGYLKLGDGGQNKTPQDTVIKNNIFYETTIDDNTSALDPYDCSHNLLFETAGNGFEHSPCSNLIRAEPKFADISGGDVRLLPDSPGLAAGDDGLNVGASTCGAGVLPVEPPVSADPPAAPTTETPIIGFPKLDETFAHLFFIPLAAHAQDDFYSGLTCLTP